MRRQQPGLRLVVLAKHGLVVWGDTAEEAYRRTIEVINQAVAFVNERTGHAPRFGGRHPAAERVSDAAREQLLRELLPTVRGAVSSERHKLLTLDTSQRSVEFVSSAQAEHLVTVGAPCPDHLVHASSCRCGSRPTPSQTTPTRCVVGSPSARRRSVPATASTSRPTATRRPCPADPDPRIVLIQHLGLVATGTTTKTSRISRDLYHRAIEVMAGAEALGEFVSLDAEESFAIEYWPRALQARAGAAAGELQGQSRSSPAGPAGSAARSATLGAAGACVVAFDLDRAGAGDAVAARRWRLAVSGDVTDEAAVAAAFAAAVERFGGVDIVVSNAGIASSAPIEDVGRVGAQPRHPGDRLLPRGPRGVPRPARAGPWWIDRLRRLQERDRGRKNASAYSSAKAAELHLAAASPRRW